MSDDAAINWPIAEQVKTRHESTNVRVEYGMATFGKFKPEPLLKISLPNGRNRSTTLYWQSQWEGLLAADINFDDKNVLGEYYAWISYKSGLIEAKLKGVQDLLENFPSAQEGLTSDVDSDQDSDIKSIVFGLSSGRRVEISQATKDFACHFSWDAKNLTLKIHDSTARTHDAALVELEEIANSLSVEIGLAVGKTVELWRQLKDTGPPEDVSRAVDRARHNSRTISTLGSRYPATAVQLYLRAQSIQTSLDGTRQYLAYYQILEYFFPVYARRDLLNKVKDAIKDPRFNRHSDVDIGKIIYLIEHDSLTRASEREQLTGLIQNCIDDRRLAEYLSDRAIKNYFFNQKSLTDVPTVNLEDKNASLASQVARRIYSIRCKIVHTKDGVIPEILSDINMPLGGGKALKPDLYLIEEIAKGVIVASGEPLKY